VIFGQMFDFPKNDVVAGIVVFLVALPLCLGIAIASGVPPVSGLVAGIVGGLVIPFLSRSALSVSGPAAGLAAIVLVEVDVIGLPAFLTAVVLAGLMQVAFGLLRAGVYSTLVPSSVIKGMLAAIGATIVLKQIPTALGVKAWSEIATQVHPGSAVIAVTSLAILYAWRASPLQKVYWLPPALVVVALATAASELFTVAVPALALDPKQLVSVPTGGVGALMAALPRPDANALTHASTWIAAGTVAIVASLETLLSVQAVDRLDPLHRRSPPDRELIAQGVGNTVSGLLGGLPITAVIVRSGANVAAGGRERLSAVVHGVLLVVAIFGLGTVLNHIPLAVLAAVLIQVGLTLCRVSLWREQYRLGFDQFAPFAITVAAILYEDLLVGVTIGIVVGVGFVLRNAARGTVEVAENGGEWLFKLRRDGTFVAKAALQSAFDSVPDGGKAILDATGEYMDHDMKELVAAFQVEAARRKIDFAVKGLDLSGVSGGGAH
jgi:MFS superfamily sulfate permease-like transporter